MTGVLADLAIELILQELLRRLQAGLAPPKLSEAVQRPPWTEEEAQERCLLSLEAWILVTLRNPSNNQVEVLCRYSELSSEPLETFLSLVREQALHDVLSHRRPSSRRRRSSAFLGRGEGPDAEVAAVLA